MGTERPVSIAEKRIRHRRKREGEGREGEGREGEGREGEGEGEKEERTASDPFQSGLPNVISVFDILSFPYLTFYAIPFSILSKGRGL
jgi:hypothetical protein